MPEITRFYGIIIKLFFGDHPPPHFHAVYGEHNAIFNIETLELIEGDLPTRARKLVVEWAIPSKYRISVFQFPMISKFSVSSERSCGT